MNLFLTKKLTKKLKVNMSSEQPEQNDALYSWRANYVQEHGRQFVVFMNDASRLTIVVNDAKAAKLKQLPELFRETLQATLVALDINPDLISRYMIELGEINYFKNSDRTPTSRHNKCVDAVWYALQWITDDVELSVWANNWLHGASGDGERNYTTPKENIINLFNNYSCPVLKFQALDIKVRLDLDGKDAIRRLRVSANTSFNNFHRILQRAFKWNNSHLFSFGLFKEWREQRYNKPDMTLLMDAESLGANPDDILIQGKFLSDFVPEYKKILYTYDFGDNWCHYIEVENIIEGCEEELPTLLSGEGDAPPENVGGSGGFVEFLDVLANPNHEDYEDMNAWAKSQWWTPFDFEKVARDVRFSLVS